MRKPHGNQSTELYLEERLLITVLWESELLGNNDYFLLLKGSSDPFPKYSPVICGLFATQSNKFSVYKAAAAAAPLCAGALDFRDATDLYF